MSFVSRFALPLARLVRRPFASVTTNNSNVNYGAPSARTMGDTIKPVSDGRFFSSMPTSGDAAQMAFKAKPPKELNLEMARSIQDANLLILKHGVGKQRLELLSESSDDEGAVAPGGFKMSPLVSKWQRMMEIYLGAQLHIIAALGYPANEEGIIMYTQHLAEFVTNKAEPEVQEELRLMGCNLWRTMLVTAFKLDRDELKRKGELSIVDARNQAHKVSSRLVEPKVLEQVMSRCAALPFESNVEKEMGMKHFIIQDVVVHQVYLGSDGGQPSLVEELGYGSGSQGYARMQYTMAYHENDPLCGQYTATAMVKIWRVAGLDFGQHAGNMKMPLSLPSAT